MAPPCTAVLRSLALVASFVATTTATAATTNPATLRRLDALVGPGGPGTGCEKAMTAVCGPAWRSDKQLCEGCVAQHLPELEPNCTKEKALRHCDNPPAPPSPSPSGHVPDPPEPPAPPVAPRAGAPQPHLILFVIDDQGAANVGFKNPGNVITPNMDALASSGIVLDRHYTYRWCAPTRSALMTGRLPYHVLQNTDHVSRGFTMLPRKLGQVGYQSHQIGKWHCGEAATWMTPAGRGFNSSLGYLSGGEDHYSQLDKSFIKGSCAGVDLYDTDAPAYGRNGTYGSYIYNDEIQRVLREYHESGATHPLFLYIALQVMHAPQQVPVEYSDLYTKQGYTLDYGIMNGMATIADAVLGNLTTTLQAYGMWNHTLLVHTADNGGPAGVEASGHCGNNYPLRGGKTNYFEGGVRVVSYVSGGFLPAESRGQTRDGYVHAADWYPTFAWLAGVDAEDNFTAGYPPVDGMDMWPYLTGEVSASPREEIMLGCEGGTFGGALINGSYKLLQGVQTYGDWWAPVYPNASTDHKADVAVDCSAGCLFDIQNDPSEYHDLAKEQPELLRAMQALFAERCATNFTVNKYGGNVTACKTYLQEHRGFVGPYLGSAP